MLPIMSRTIRGGERRVGGGGDLDGIVRAGGGERYHGRADAEEAEAGGGAAREIDDAGLMEGLAVVDGDDDGGAGVLHGDADSAAEGQGAVGGGKAGGVEDFAAAGG